MESKWISVKDQLPEATGGTTIFPETSETVLMWDENCNYSLGCYDTKEKRWEDYNSYNLPVTHWMPLPEPPKS